MASTIWEFFGLTADAAAVKFSSKAPDGQCPFINQECVKSFRDGTISGVCAIKPKTSAPVICCPQRLYFENYKILRDVSELAFDATYELVSGHKATSHAIKNKKYCVAVFGHRWSKELRIPTKTSGSKFSIDWTLALIDETGALKEFVAVEVQSIDTTGNYRAGYNGILAGASGEPTTAGLNWENVNKRILPQLVYKGQVLQRETLCKKGLFFVCPAGVFNKIVNRLGGKEKLADYALQPASLTFMVYDYDEVSPKVDKSGKLAVSLVERHTTTVYKVQEAFNNVSLPEADIYKSVIEEALKE